MHIMVLGGAGKMGCIAVQSLAKETRATKVTIADVNLENARLVADTLQSEKLEIKKVDINDHAAFVAALEGVDACVNATVYYTNLKVMEACLEAGVHYTDMGGLFFTTRKQLELHDRFAAAGVSAVLGMGSAPGIPNIQARYAADRLDTIESIKIYDGIKPPASKEALFTYAVPTILDELTMSPMAFENGEFVAKEPLTGFEDYWFTPPLGVLPMHYSLHSEVATLPISFKDKGVKECFFKINYWGMAKEVVEKINVLAELGFGRPEPVDVKGQMVSPRDMMVAMLSSYVPPITDYLKPAATRPPDWAKEIVTEVTGKKDGKDVVYRLGTTTCKGALPTGLAPALAAIWMAEGRVRAGVQPPELAFEPEAFLKELEAWEVPTSVTVKTSL